MQDDKKNLSSLNKITMVVYILQAVSMLTALPMIVGVIINYVKLDDARDTWFESHFRWQLRTFWFGLLFYIIAFMLHIILIGFIIGGITWLWQVYRITKGCWRLSEQKSMYQ